MLTKQGHYELARRVALLKLYGEHSAILLTFIKLPFVIEIVVLSTFEWPFYTYFTTVITTRHLCLQI